MPGVKPSARAMVRHVLEKPFDLQTTAEQIFAATEDQMHQAGNHIPFRDRCAGALETMEA